MLAIITLFALLNGAAGIGCFVCSSFNGSNPHCEDPFNSTYDLQDNEQRDEHQLPEYNHPCWTLKKDRRGLFPADHCIKIKGYRAGDPSHTVVIRTCAMDSGTLTADTEIVRISHCGNFKYEGEHFSGCVQSCASDGCNSAPKQSISSIFAFLIFIASYVLAE